MLTRFVIEAPFADMIEWHTLWPHRSYYFIPWIFYTFVIFNCASRGTAELLPSS